MRLRPMPTCSGQWCGSVAGLPQTRHLDVIDTYRLGVRQLRGLGLGKGVVASALAPALTRTPLCRRVRLVASV